MTPYSWTNEVLYQYTIYNKKGRIETVGLQEASTEAGAMEQIAERWRLKHGMPTRAVLVEKEFWRIVNKKEKEMTDREFMLHGLYNDKALKEFHEQNDRMLRQVAEIKVAKRLKYPENIVMRKIIRPRISI